MPTLNWIGKEAVVNYHHKVPFRLLRDVPRLGFGDAGDGNLVIQGDNLLALKALLPYYAGQVKCVYIDPPYNTGTENWAYNDNVNSPLIRRWLGEVVGREGETLDRHDRWLCMMYPRLQLLKRLLSRDGILAVSIDDNEVSFLGLLLDEIFGTRNRLAVAPWLAEPSGGREKTGLRGGHEYVLIYHGGDDTSVSREVRSAGDLNLKDRWGKYRKGRELMKWGGTSQRSDRPGQWYPLRTPGGIEVWPIKNNGEEGHWRWGREQKMKEVIENPDRAHWELRPFDAGISWNGATERWVPYEKIRDSARSVGWSTWLDKYGYNADATRELKEIFGGKKPFDTPKPLALVKWLVSLHDDDNALVLDSFAGSGTTGHAVLSLNNDDGGNRRFILVESEARIAEEITAERLRRVIAGYTNPAGQEVPGIPGAFRFCELGDPLFDSDGRIREEVTFSELARHVYFTETGEPLPRERVTRSPFLGACRGVGIYLLYNGILGDKTPNGGNVLTRSVLASLPSFDGPKVIYCAGCLLGRERLQTERVVVRQTPYEIRLG